MLSLPEEAEPCSEALAPALALHPSQCLSWAIHLTRLETRKDTGIRAARHYQTQQAMTETESLWALYSDSWRSEKMAGLHPNRLSCLVFPGQDFYSRG